MKKISLIFFLFIFQAYSIKVYKPIQKISEKKVTNYVKKADTNTLEYVYKLKYADKEEVIKALNNIVKINYVNGYLVLIGKSDDINKAKNILKLVDKVKRQILISVNVIETSKNLFDKVGISINKNDNNVNLSSLLKSGEISFLKFLDLGGLGINIDLLKDKGDISISSLSQILVVENSNANFIIGEDNKLVYKEGKVINDNAGLILKIIPKIVIDDDVEKIELTIYYESSKFSGVKNSLNKKKNVLETKIILLNNQYRFIGGLKEKIENKNESKIPILSEIPLIGRIFTTTGNVKTEKDLYVEVKGVIIEK